MKEPSDDEFDPEKEQNLQEIADWIQSLKNMVGGLSNSRTRYILSDDELFNDEILEFEEEGNL